MPVDQSTRAPRRGRPGHDLDAVVAAATRVFIRRGFDAASVEDVARELGVSKSAVYHHVGGKDELLDRALAPALDGLDALAGRLDALPAPALARLEAVVHDSVLLLVAHLPSVTLLLRVRGNTEVERRALARRRRFDAGVATLVAAAVAEGSVRPGIEPADVARLLFGAVNSLTEWYRPRPGDDGRQIAETVRRLLFDGLRAAPTA